MVRLLFVLCRLPLLKSLSQSYFLVRKGAMDPLDASLGDIEPNDVDLDFLLDSFVFVHLLL